MKTRIVGVVLLLWTVGCGEEEAPPAEPGAEAAARRERDEEQAARADGRRDHRVHLKDEGAKRKLADEVQFELLKNQTPQSKSTFNRLPLQS